MPDTLVGKCSVSYVLYLFMMTGSVKSKLKKFGKQSQSTVVLRQAKLHLNRSAMNKSKTALARSLKVFLLECVLM